MRGLQDLAQGERPAEAGGRPALRRPRPIYALRGLRNYLKHQARVLRETYRDARDPWKDPLPIPPPALRYRVTKSFDRAQYVDIGRRCAEDLRALLRTAGRDLESFRDVLDFGCGAGRVVRHLRDGQGERRIHGSDIDSEAIAWCRRHLPFGRWETNGDRPPACFPDGSFDLVYAISVFTHLPEDLQQAWLGEFRRLLRTGGLLLLTIHGSGYAGPMSDDSRRRLAASGVLYTTRRVGRFKLDGLPDYYQTAYHTRAYVERTWSKQFRVLHYVERAMNGDQDAVILCVP